MNIHNFFFTNKGLLSSFTRNCLLSNVFQYRIENRYILLWNDVVVYGTLRPVIQIATLMSLKLPYRQITDVLVC